MQVVGWEGVFGFSYYMVALPIMQQISCTPTTDFCPDGKIEDSIKAFHQMGSNLRILFSALGVICTIAFFNYFGVATTKYASAPQRSTIDTSRTVLIWIFFLTVNIPGAHEQFHWLQLLGFILLVIGTLIYNEIVTVPFFGFDQYTQEAIAKRNLTSNGLKKSLGSNYGGNNNDYVGTSPHAGYDDNRNKRAIDNNMDKGLMANDDYEIKE